jgi:hypothetical protein
MSYIGAVNFVKMEGPQVPSLAAAVEIIDRDGVDSVATRIDALKAEDITKYTTEAVANLSTAQSAADDYASLKGWFVTVCDDTGRITYSVKVIDVRVLGVQAMAVSSPANLNYLINAVWILKPTL